MESVRFSVFSGIVFSLSFLCFVSPAILLSEDEPAPAAVRTVKSRRGSLRKWINSSGFVAPRGLVTVTSIAEGDVYGEIVETGTFVNEGAELFSMKNELLKSELARKEALLEGRQAALDALSQAAEKEAVLEVSRAKRDYLMAQADLQNAKMEYDGKKALGVSGMLAGQELQLARANFDKAKASVEYLKAVFQNRKDRVESKLWKLEIKKTLADVNSSRADLSASRYLFDSLKVSSPISGMVVMRMVERGAHVRPGEELYRIADTKTMFCDCYLDGRAVREIKIGQLCRLSLFDGLAAYEGVVDVVSPAAIPEKGGHLVRIRIEAVDNNVIMGAYLSAKIQVVEKRGIIILPARSVLKSGNEEYVYIVTPKKTALKKIVTTGIEEDGSIEVVTGLSEGEDVIVEGVHNVKDGSKVASQGGR